MANLPLAIEMLAEVGDPRALPIMRKALASGNYTMQYEAAMGLAVLQDKGSIPAIVAAVKNAPPEGRPIIARGLLGFDDPDARAAAQKFITNTAELQQITDAVKAKGPRAAH